MTSVAFDHPTQPKPYAVFDLIIEGLLIGLLAFAPLAFGAVQAWSEMICVVLASVIAFVLLLRMLILGKNAFVWTWAYVPIAGLGVWGAIQLISLPAYLVRIVSPTTFALRTNLLNEVYGVNLDSMPLSLYPWATQHSLRMLFVGMVVFVAVVNIVRSPARIKRLLAAITVIAAAIACLAMAQILTRTSSVYWYFPIRKGCIANSGPFFNHNHFGQFMNLSIGAALGWLLVELRHRFNGENISLASVMERLLSRGAWIIWILIGVVVISITTVALSLTRGGMLSLLLAGSITSFALVLKRGLRDWRWIIGVLIALFALLIVLHIGFEGVYLRLCSVWNTDAHSGRWQMIVDSTRAWSSFPITGTGMGCHEMVFPMFDRQGLAGMSSHAENEYVQLAEEAGLIGLIILIAFMTIIAKSYIRCLRHMDARIQASAFGLGLGLIAVIVQSTCDFGQRIPANFCLSAVMAGLLVVLANREQAEAPPASIATVFRRSTMLQGLLVVGTLAFCIWLITSANRSRIAQDHWQQALMQEQALARSGWTLDNSEFASILRHAESATAIDPGNVSYKYWLNVYRWRAISRVVDSKTNSLIATPQILQHTKRIADALTIARKACPTFSRLYSLEGQLRYLVLKDTSGMHLIETGYQLAPSDPSNLYLMGLVRTLQGQTGEAHRLFRRCIQLCSSFNYSVVNVYLNITPQPHLAVEVSENDMKCLLHVVRQLQIRQGNDIPSAEALGQAILQLKAICKNPETSPDDLVSVARVCRRNHDPATAVEYLQRALSKNNARTAWQMELAYCFEDIGQKLEARKHALAILHKHPDMREARDLLNRLNER